MTEYVMPIEAMALVPASLTGTLAHRDQFAGPLMVDFASPSSYEYERDAFFAQFNKYSFEKRLRQLEDLERGGQLDLERYGQLAMQYQSEKVENLRQLAELEEKNTKLQEIPDKFLKLYKNYYDQLGITIPPFLERKTQNQINESDIEVLPPSDPEPQSDKVPESNISLSAEQVAKNHINLSKGICLISSALVIVHEIACAYAAENFFPDEQWKQQLYLQWLELVAKIEDFENEIEVVPVKRPEFLQFLESNIFERSFLFGITIATGSWIFCIGTGFFIVSRAIELLVTLILSTLNSLVKFVISLFEEYMFTPRAEKETKDAVSANKQTFEPLNDYLNEIVVMFKTSGATPTYVEQVVLNSTIANTQALTMQAQALTKQTEAVRQLDSSMRQTGGEFAKGLESILEKKLAEERKLAAEERKLELAEQQQAHQNQIKLLLEQFLDPKRTALAQTSISPEANPSQNISQPNSQRTLSVDAFEEDFQQTMSVPGAIGNTSINNKDRADANNLDNRVDSVGRYSSDIDIDKEAEEITEKFSPEQITQLFASIQRRLSVAPSLSVSPR